jgi:hypothetical protein
MWGIQPNITMDGKQVYYFYSPSFITGVGMVLAVGLSILVGALKLRFSYHIYFILFAILLCFFHGSQRILSSAFGDTMVLITLITCSIIYFLFNFSTNYMKLRVVGRECFLQTTQEGTSVLLVVEAPLFLTNLPPGCYFTIYDSRMRWQLFRGHPFSLLYSSQHPQFLSFFIRVDKQPSSVTEYIHAIVANAYP